LQFFFLLDADFLLIMRKPHHHFIESDFFYGQLIFDSYLED